MSIAPGFSDFSSLHRLPFATPLATVIGHIHEVHPAAPSEGGSRQMLRITWPQGVPFDVLLFDQGSVIPMNLQGGVVRLTASPNALKALVWEKSKAAKPSANVGVLVVRKQARVETFHAQQALTAGVTTLGFMVAVRSQPSVALPEAQSQLRFNPTPPALSTTNGTAVVACMPQELARLYLDCLAAARNVRGPHDSDDDVRAAARATFEVMQRQHAA